MRVTVRQKVKGRGNPWWVFINHDGKRTSRRVGDKPAGQAVASKIRAQLELGEFGLEVEENKMPTFKEYSESFMDGYSRFNHKETTRASYRDVLRLHLLPTFGNQSLDQITRKDVKGFIHQKQREGLSLHR